MIDWNNIDQVFLDMDGTLLDLDFDNHFWQVAIPERYAEKHRLSIEQARRELVPRFRAREKTLAWYCVDFWTRELDLDIAALKHELRGRIRILPHASEFLLQLRASSRQTILVTNAHPKSIAIKMKKTQLAGMLDTSISTHRFGVPKENPSFWKKLQRRVTYDPACTLLIDDSLHVLEAARTAGLQNLLAISKPDSTRAAHQVQGFDSIKDFREIMPVPVRQRDLV